MKAKSTKENFLNSVREVLSREKLTKKQIRLFVRKARTYTCAYYAFDNKLLKDSAVMRLVVTTLYHILRNYKKHSKHTGVRLTLIKKIVFLQVNNF